MFLTISPAKPYEGVRSIVFYAAVGCAYNNDTGTHESSIFYSGNDLNVNLLFFSMGGAGTFVNKVEADLNYYELEMCKITSCETKSEVFINETLHMLMLNDYKNPFVGSPMYMPTITHCNCRSSYIIELAKLRDKYACTACGLSFADSKDTSQYKAVHILDVEDEEAAFQAGGELAHQQLLESVNLLGAEELLNHICLCRQCHHDYFDNYLICINNDASAKTIFWEVNESVVDNDMPGQQGKYGDIQGKEIIYRQNCYLPPQLVNYRMQKFLTRAGGKKRKLPVG